MIGRVLKSRYELVGLIQEGPIFATYAGRDRIQGRDVSIRLLKQPFSSEAEFIDRLSITVQKYASLQSVNVERLQSLETDVNDPYILGDLTRGPSLSDRIRKLAPFSIPVSVGTAISILHALDSVHRSGLVHGDINPQNLIVMADGDVRLQLTGIWEAYSGSPTAGIMVLPGMAPYLAPEISNGAMPSSSSDVYAVGILLYELIIGRLPYQAETTLALALQHSTAATPSLRAVSIAVPVVLDEIVKKAMSKDPRNRYVSAGDMLVDLRMVQDALRFGRSLSWPLRAETVQTGPLRTGKGPAGRPQPVAPKMSAVRKRRKPKNDGDAEVKERDVPLWMWFGLTVAATLAVAVFGTWIVQNLSKPIWVTVPKIQTMNVNEARALLRENHLTLRITKKRPSDQIPQDAILEVSPEPGQKILQNGEVSVIVSSGSRMVAVPDLQGDTVDKAKALLATLNLVLVEPATKESDSKIPAGMIIRSNPPAKTSVERQSPVRLVISLGASEAPPQTTQADSSTVTEPQADSSTESIKGYDFYLHLNLKDLTLRTKVRIDMLDEAGIRTIYEQKHKPGDVFDVIGKGKKAQATFNIYYDGTLVKSVDMDTMGKVSTKESIQPDTAGGAGEGQ